MAAEAASLERGRHGHVLDHQVIALVDRLDEGGEATLEEGEVDAMLAHRLLMVGLHRLGFAADHGHPFGIGFAREHTHGGGIVRHRAPQRRCLVHGESLSRA